MNTTEKPKPTPTLITTSSTDGGGILFEVYLSEASLELTPVGCNAIWISPDVPDHAREELRAILLPVAEKWLKELGR